MHRRSSSQKLQDIVKDALLGLGNPGDVVVGADQARQDRDVVRAEHLGVGMGLAPRRPGADLLDLAVADQHRAVGDCGVVLDGTVARPTGRAPAEILSFPS